MKTMMSSKPEGMEAGDKDSKLRNEGLTVISLPVVATEEQAASVGQLGIVNKMKLLKLKYKVILAIVLGLGCIIAAVIVTYLGLYYSRSETGTTQIFHMVLHDKNVQSDEIRLDITVEPKDQLEFSRSPQEGIDAHSSVLLGLKDFNKGIVAYKEDNGTQCFISKIVTNSLLHTLANGTVQEAIVEQDETYVELNQTIHPFVLRLAAGDNIVDFCGRRDAIWMIPINEFEDKVDDDDDEENKRDRQKRWLCWGWGCGTYRRCWWNCTWWGWKKFCSRRCYY